MLLNPAYQLTRYELQCIANAIIYINQEYRNHISPEKLAMEVGIGIKKLQAGLKRETGMTLHDYLLKVRVENSKPILLNTNLPLKNIARSTGFKTKSHFCRIFKKITGITANVFRSQNEG